MRQKTWKSLEWPSLALCAGIYGAFLALTWFAAQLPAWMFVSLGALIVAWHSSMQHEFIHGHPTPWGRVNRALANVPLSFWLPFEAYRVSHLTHHRDDRLTDPLDDPESYYWTVDQWAALGWARQRLVRAHTTLAGRLLLGPAWNISRFLESEARAVLARDPFRRRVWRAHLVVTIPLAIWLFAICGVDPLLYALTVYAGTSLLLLRSFAEHRASAGVLERTAIVENSWFFGPLFLFNNLHAAHHERPCVAWYRLPRWYRDNRHRLINENGGLVYNGYGAVASRYLFRPHDQVLHPTASHPGQILTAH